MIKKALLATTALVLLTSASQAGPSWKEVLRDVAIASVAPQAVYYQPAPRVVYYTQPVHRCRETYQYQRNPQAIIVEDRYGNRYVQPRPW
jgi:hypothetical protein